MRALSGLSCSSLCRHRLLDLGPRYLARPAKEIPIEAGFHLRSPGNKLSHTVIEASRRLAHSSTTVASMSAVAELEPKTLWQFFERLSQIPRPSKHEEKCVLFFRILKISKLLRASRDTTIEDTQHVTFSSKPYIECHNLGASMSMLCRCMCLKLY